MISIHMGSRCLLKAEPAGTDPDGSPRVRDLVYGVTMPGSQSLASLFDDRDIDLVREARWLRLEVNAGPPRTFDIRYEVGEVEECILVSDEIGSSFDFHDVTLSWLMAPAEEVLPVPA